MSAFSIATPSSPKFIPGSVVTLKDMPDLSILMTSFSGLGPSREDLMGKSGEFCYLTIE
jgi:hypothetical protein